MTRPTREEVEQQGRLFYLNEICNAVFDAIDQDTETKYQAAREVKLLVLELNKARIALLDKNEHLKKQVNALSDENIYYLYKQELEEEVERLKKENDYIGKTVVQLKDKIKRQTVVVEAAKKAYTMLGGGDPLAEGYPSEAERILEEALKDA